MCKTSRSNSSLAFGEEHPADWVNLVNVFRCLIGSFLSCVAPFVGTPRFLGDSAQGGSFLYRSNSSLAFGELPPPSCDLQTAFLRNLGQNGSRVGRSADELFGRIWFNGGHVLFFSGYSQPALRPPSNPSAGRGRKKIAPLRRSAFFRPKVDCVAEPPFV